jgi:hypothetical protein
MDETTRQAIWSKAHELAEATASKPTTPMEHYEMETNANNLIDDLMDLQTPYPHHPPKPPREKKASRGRT